MTAKTTKHGGGIFVRDGRWLMQCGGTTVPVETWAGAEATAVALPVGAAAEGESRNERTTNHHAARSG